MSESVGEGNDTPSEYKEVMLGPKLVMVPISWEVKEFSSAEVSKKIKAGGTPTASNDKFYGGNIKYVKIEDMTSAGKFVHETKTTLTEQGLESSSTWLVPEKSLLLSMYGSYGKVAITADEVATNQAILGIIPSESIDLDYLFHASSRLKPYFESVVLETTQANLNKGIVENTPILVPPFSEQRGIADILSTIDEQIQQTDEIINKTQELQRGVLNELIPRGINGHGKLRPSPEDKPELYDEVRRCTIPIGWEVSTLQELCKEDVTYGIVQAGPHVDDGVPYIKTGDMTDGKLELDGLTRTSPEIAEDYNRSKIRAGELVIAIRATVGVVHQVPPELDGGNLTQGTARISPKDSIDNRYLLWAIRTNIVQSLIDARTKGSTFSEITLGTLRKVPIPYPESLEEQKRIAERLDVISEKLDDERSYLRGLRELKRGLMQDLLTGKIRVNTD